MSEKKEETKTSEAAKHEIAKADSKKAETAAKEVSKKTETKAPVKAEAKADAKPKATDAKGSEKTGIQPVTTALPPALAEQPKPQPRDLAAEKAKQVGAEQAAARAVKPQEVPKVADHTENLKPGEVHPLVAESPDPVDKTIQDQVDDEEEVAPKGWTHKARLRVVQCFRPYSKGENMKGIFVADEDKPEEGGMIIVNPNNPKDQWYVSKAFYENNYDPI